METARSSHHFLHQTDELHQTSTQLGDLLLHFGHVLLIDLHQRLERVSSMLHIQNSNTRWFTSGRHMQSEEAISRKTRHYHAAPKGTLVADALLTGPAENTQLLMVVLTSAIKDNDKAAAEQKALLNGQKKSKWQLEQLLTCLCHCPHVWWDCRAAGCPAAGWPLLPIDSSPAPSAAAEPWIAAAAAR